MNTLEEHRRREDDRLREENRRLFWPAMNVAYRRLDAMSGDDLRATKRQLLELIDEGKRPPPASASALDIPMAR